MFRDGTPPPSVICSSECRGLRRCTSAISIRTGLASTTIFASGALIARWQGSLFLFYYVAYTAYLVLAAQQHDALPAFSAVMQALVLPLTAVTLAVVGWRAWRRPAA